MINYRVVWSLALALLVSGMSMSTAMAQQGEEEEEAGEITTSDLAGFKLGPSVGFEIDFGDPYIGADARYTMDVHPDFALAINPAFQYVFVSNVTVFQLDTNALFKFPIDEMITPYAGAGLGITRVSFAGFGSTDLAINLLGGAEFDVHESFDAFAQLKLSLVSGGNLVMLGGGILFDLDL